MRFSSFSGSTRCENSGDPYAGKFLRSGGSIEMVRPGFVIFVYASRVNRTVSSSLTATKRTRFGKPVVLSGCRILKKSLALFETVVLVIAPFLVKLRSSFRKGVSVASCSNAIFILHVELCHAASLQYSNGASKS